MTLIDSHFHIYKSDKAGLMAQGGASLIGFNGTLEEATAILDRGKIYKILGLAVIPISAMRISAMKKWPEDASSSQKQALSIELEHTLQDRLIRYNAWLCEKARADGRIEPVIAADPSIGRDVMMAEIEAKYEEYHIKALKIHPSVSRAYPDDEGYLPVYALAQEKGLPIITHGGISGDDLEGKFCGPEKFQPVLENFPNLKLVVAHLGFPHYKPLLELGAKYENCYTDVSNVLKSSMYKSDLLCDIIRGFGPERVLFGSDFPWSDPEKDVDRLINLKLTQHEIDMLAHENALALFKL